MTSTLIIDDILPYTQAVATAGQTVFSTTWTADVASDVKVYARAAGVDANDVTQLVSSADYNIAFIGAERIVRVTFTDGRTLNDVVTITRLTPADRQNLYTNSNFTPSMLNGDFGRVVLIMQQNQMFWSQIQPRYNTSETIVQIEDTILPILEENQIWAKNPDNDAIIPYDVPASGGVAPKLASYLIQTATSELPNAQAMGALATGFMQNTTGTGVQTTRVLTGAANQINIDNGNGATGNPTWTVSSTLNLPGTFTIQGSTVVNEIINDATMATAGTDNLSTSTAIKSYVDAAVSTTVTTITGTANQIIASASSGPVTLSAPQDIATTSSPTFAGATFTAAVDMSTQLINNVLNPVADQDAATKKYVDDTSGGTATAIVGTANQVLANGTSGVNQTGIVTMTAPQDIATTSSPSFAGATFTAAVDMDNQLINNVLDPVDLQDAATKNYVDAIAQGLTVKAAVNASSTANYTVVYDNGTAGVGATLTNDDTQAAFVADGQTLAVGKRVLIKNQTAKLQNGIYIVTVAGDVSTNWVLTRTTDFDQPDNIVAGSLVPVLSGTVNSNTKWVQTDDVAVVGTDDIDFILWMINVNRIVTTDTTQTITGAKTMDSLTLGGNLDADSNKIINLLDPTLDQDAATKKYVDDKNPVLTNGQLIIGRTGDTPIAGTLTAGTGITITEGSGSITIDGAATSMVWTEVTATTQAMAVDNGYIANNAGTVVFTLPATAALGTLLKVVGKGAGGWQIDQNAGQQIHVGNASSTAGTGGSVASTHQRDSLSVVCTEADSDWTTISAVGNITIT